MQSIRGFVRKCSRAFEEVPLPPSTTKPNHFPLEQSAAQFSHYIFNG